MASITLLMLTVESTSLANFWLLLTWLFWRGGNFSNIFFWVEHRAAIDCSFQFVSIGCLSVGRGRFFSRAFSMFGAISLFRFCAGRAQATATEAGSLSADVELGLECRSSAGDCC